MTLDDRWNTPEKSDFEIVLDPTHPADSFSAPHSLGMLGFDYCYANHANRQASAGGSVR